jgi:CubicO group peptidase (beta-lactamase class C family)
MTTPQPSTFVQDRIEKYLLPLPRKVQLAIALIRGDKTEFVGAERTSGGIRFLDNRGSVFEIGSITKVFTATLLADAVGQGIIQLDAPVQEYLPFKLKMSGLDGAEITVKHLANHTSGMRHQPPLINLLAILEGHPREPFKNYTNTRFERYLKRDMKLAFAPGTKYSYSNMGMSLVGYVLSLLANETFEELLQTKIFHPFGMDLSTTQVAKVKEHVVAGWAAAKIPAPNWDMYALSPAGGIKTCAEDFAKFIISQFSNNPVNILTQTPTFNIEEGYHVGLGWHIIDRKSGETWLNHGGGMLGYTANVNVNVNKKYAAIVLSNLGNSNHWQSKIFELCRDLLVDIETNGKSMASQIEPIAGD